VKTRPTPAITTPMNSSRTATFNTTLTLTNPGGTSEVLSVEDIRMFREMCEFVEYLTDVDPQTAQYLIAFRTKRRILR
jgi:hypothetical protein